MRIQVVSRGPTETAKGKNGKSYSFFEFTYKNLDKGETKTRKIMSFDDAIAPVLSEANSGDAFDVRMEKKGEFWNWVEINPTDGVDVEAAPTKGRIDSPRFPKGASDTDIRIARSVALKAAVDFLGTVAKTKGPDYVAACLDLANEFEGYLINGFIPPVLVAAVASDTIEDDDLQ